MSCQAEHWQNREAGVRMRTVVMATAVLLSGCGVPPMGHLAPSIEVVFPADLSEVEAVEDAEGNVSWPLTIVVDVDNFRLMAPDADAEPSSQEGHWHVMCGDEKLASITDGGVVADISVEQGDEACLVRPGSILTLGVMLAKHDHSVVEVDDVEARDAIELKPQDLD